MRAVLTFHSIDDSGSVLSFPVRSFARMVENLARSGIPVVRFSSLLQQPAGVTLTFDDGMRSVFEHALPVLASHGYPAHLFLTTGTVGTTNAWPSQSAQAPRFPMIDWKQLETCVQRGFLVESHTATHPDLRTLPDPAIVAECAAADDVIESRLGRRPTLFAYPYGLADQRVRSAVGRSYEACFSTRLDYVGNALDPADVPRIDTYFVRAPMLFENLLSARTRSYLALRGLIRRVRGKT